VELAPGIPDGLSPLAHASNVAFWINRVAYVSDGQCSALSLWRLGRSLKNPRTIEPSLNSLIRLESGLPFERRIHSREMRGVRLGRAHVLRRVLQRVRVNRQPVDAPIPEVTELPRQDFVEKRLTRRAATGHHRPALGAAGGGCIELS
jgi:hypothetical protein